MDYAVYPLPSSGSARKYYRIATGESSYLLCLSENIRENETFLKLTEYFLNKKLNIPKIFWHAEDKQSYIIQDLGVIDLLELLTSKRSNAYKEVNDSICQLVRFQRLPHEEWESIVEFPPFDSELIRYDCRYAINNLLIPYLGNYNFCRLEQEYEILEKRLLAYPKEFWGLMYRDFQSRNIMIHEGSPYFIDYQSCRYGPGVYDLVSFAWQAKARFSETERSEIVSIYFQELEKRTGIQTDHLKEEVAYWAIFRVTQTLGAYGLRGLKEGKKHFIESIPLALNNLKEILEKDGIRQMFPEMNKIVHKVLTFL